MKIRILILGLTLLMGQSLGACKSGAPDDPNLVRIDGSTVVEPLAKEAAKLYIETALVRAFRSALAAPRRASSSVRGNSTS